MDLGELLHIGLKFKKDSDNSLSPPQKTPDKGEIRTHAPFETTELNEHVLRIKSLTWRLGPLGHLASIFGYSSLGGFVESCVPIESIFRWEAGTLNGGPQPSWPTCSFFHTFIYIINFSAPNNNKTNTIFGYGVVANIVDSHCKAVNALNSPGFDSRYPSHFFSFFSFGFQPYLP